MVRGVDGGVASTHPVVQSSRRRVSRTPHTHQGGPSKYHPHVCSCKGPYSCPGSLGSTEWETETKGKFQLAGATHVGLLGERLMVRNETSH